MKTLGLFGVAAVVGSFGLAGAGSLEKGAGPDGRWGGVGIQVEIGPSSVGIELDGASGRIERPLALDDAGRFEAKGTFVRERPGPTRQGEAAPAPEPAVYSGAIDGDTLTLRITLTGSGAVIGPLTAKRGAPARLRKMA